MADDPVTAYWRWLLTLPLPYQWPYEDFQKRESLRRQIRITFPYTITLEKSADELAYFEQWCWNEFGPKYGNCEEISCWYETYEHQDNSSYDDNNLNHFHNGTWTTIWALKTSYVDGFCDFCFKLPENAIYFKFTFGFND